jgi:ring-1,2-phenylacetyl-CoA epoxidase subunit PaaE
MTATGTEPITRRRDTSFHALQVDAVDELTDEAVALTFSVPDELRDVFRYRAGQHLTVRLTLAGVEERRSYSICAPATSQVLRVAVKRLDGGVVSTHLTSSAQRGDTVEVMPPLGNFGAAIAHDPEQAGEYVAVCAGSGITPILSIVATVLDVEPSSTFTVVYGNRTTASVMFLEELADLKDRYLDRLQLFHVLSREFQETDVLAGRIDPDKLKALLGPAEDPRNVDGWFLCGPLDLVETTRSALLVWGVRPSDVHTEIFHVDGEPIVERTHVDARAADAVAEVTATLGGRTTRFEHRRGSGSVLDSMLAARSDAPFSCKGGVCGTCRARVVDGTVAMARHYALEPAEIEAGFVLVCQSQPTSERLALDFDQ